MRRPRTAAVPAANHQSHTVSSPVTNADVKLIHLKATSLPHRAPGSPGHGRQHLSGKPIRYYRPQGSADIRRLVDEGFQAFNAARLSEACHIFADKMLAP